MKLSFNLTKEEAQAFKNFFTSVNVNGNSEEDFIKTAFILGLRSMEATILEKMKAELEKQASEKSESVEFVEEESNETEETEE